MAHEPTEQNSNVSAPDPALGALDSRIAAARRDEDERLAQEHVPLRKDGASAGWAIASTMVGYPLGGIVIGFALDKVFGTLPWIMLGLMFAAFVAACIQIARNSNKPSAD